MFSYENLGSFTLMGSGLEKFNVASPTKKTKNYLAELIFKINVSGTASNAISKQNFLAGLCDVFNLKINNRKIVDNASYETLERFIFSARSQSPLSFPSVGSAGSYSENFYLSVPFANQWLVSPYDFAINLLDINSIEFEYKRGVIANSSGETFNISVIAKIIERENIYHSPFISYDFITISKTISDNIAISDRSLYAAMFFPKTGDFTTPIILRSKTKTFLDNLPLVELQRFFNSPMILDNLENSDLNYYPVYLTPESPASIKKPLLYENDNLFFDKMPAANSPFIFATMKIYPNENVGINEIETRYSPIIIKE